MKDKVAIITGASRGIGKEIAVAFSKAGVKVVLASRTQEDLDKVAQEIGSQGGIALPIATHIGQPGEVEKLVRKTVDEFGSINIIVNNAGTNPHFGPILTSEESMWEKTFDVNVVGYYRLVKAAYPVMKENGGKIINMSSIAGLKPQPGMGVYCISKAGVIMLTKVLAVELADDDIQVNCIAPGFIKTKFSQVLWQNEQIHEKLTKVTPQNRMATPDELTGIALYLASKQSSFTTGEVFTIDGGLNISSGVNF